MYFKALKFGVKDYHIICMTVCFEQIFDKDHSRYMAGR